MAGLLETYLQDIRTKYGMELDRDEWRNIRYGLINSALEQTNSISSVLSTDLKAKALESEGRQLDVPVIKKGALTVSNTRSCTIGEFENESDLITVTWTTLAVDFSMVKAQYAKNEIAFVDDFAKKVQLVREAIMGAIEGAIDTKLDAEKSIIYNSPLVGTKYALVANAMQVAAADRDFFFNDLTSIQNSDDFYSDQHIVGTTTLMPTVSQFMNQGPGNQVNQTFQFGDKEFLFSNSVTNGAVLATGYTMPMGTLGLLTRNNIDARMANQASDGTTWSQTFLPGIPFQLGVMHKSSCSDKSALNGSGLEHLDATHLEQWQFSLDYGIVTSYNSDPATKAGAIKKFELLV